MKWRKRFWGAMSALLITLVTLNPSARAQTPDRWAVLKISIRPECDQPTVLVLFDRVLALVALGMSVLVGWFVPRSRAREVLSTAALRGPVQSRDQHRTRVFGPLCGHAFALADNFCPQCDTQRRHVA